MLKPQPQESLQEKADIICEGISKIVGHDSTMQMIVETEPWYEVMHVVKALDVFTGGEYGKVAKRGNINLENAMMLSGRGKTGWQTTEMKSLRAKLTHSSERAAAPPPQKEVQEPEPPKVIEDDEQKVKEGDEQNPEQMKSLFDGFIASV